MSAQWKESLSLEESNKVRISLGLKPILDPNSVAGQAEKKVLTSDEQGEINYAKRVEREREERASEALKLKIDKMRNGRERARKLVGVGLGEDPNEGIKAEEGVPTGEDTKSWVKLQKKRAKELAAKRERDLAEADKRDQEVEKNRDAYGEKDLVGLKVDHEADDFEEGEDVILTLKDGRILDDDDDELHNLNISENITTAAAVALKKQGLTAGQYTGFDDDEFIEGAEGTAASVLKKYDEEIEGKAEGGFRLGGSAPLAKKSASNGKGKGKAVEEEKDERVKLNMDYTKSFINDYLVEGEVGFKKPKMKKKKRPTKTMTTSISDDDTPITTTSSTSVPAVASLSRANLDETNLIDDDDLQLSLSRARREATKKRLDASKARKEARMELEETQVKEEEIEGGDDLIIMDDTSEFVRNISRIQVAPPPIKKESNGVESIMPVIKTEAVEDEPLGELISTGGWGPAREDGEESDTEVDGDTLMGIYAGDEVPKSLDDFKPLLNPDEDDDAFETTASANNLVSNGMASTLNLLRHQGLIQIRTPEELQQDQLRKTREAWLATQRKREAERELEKVRSREAGNSKDQQTRERDNKRREQVEVRETMEAFNSYQPVVDIKYHDEFGRNQTPKEAWKQLSHNFHGKGSGTMKTEKRLKKIAEEKKRESMASGETPLNTVGAFAMRAEKLGSATMILSVGSNGAAPISNANIISIPKKASSSATPYPSASSQSKSKKSESLFGDIPMRSLPLPASTGSSGKSGFLPIGSSNGETSTIGNGGGLAGGHIVPMNVKRKAAGVPSGGIESVVKK